MLRVLPLVLLALVVTSGCDSDDPADEITLDTAYLADGDWTFDSISGNTEATARIDALLDAYTLDFDTDGTARVVIDVSDAAQDEDTRDIEAEVPYTLTGSTLLLSGSDDPDGFMVRAVSQDRMDLTGDGLYLLGLLGLDLELDLNRDATTLSLRR